MFDNILGIDTKSIDEKYRLILPKNVGCEPKEELVLICKKNYLEIRELKKVKEELQELRINLKGATSIEIKNFYQSEIDEITSCTEKVVSVDKQHRITLNKEIVTRYNFANGVKIEGIVDRIRIWNPDKFLEYQNYNLNKKSRK